VNVIVLGGPKGETLRIKNLSLAGRGRHLATGATVTLSADAGDTLLDFAQPLKGDFGPAISVSS
jgi:hypothetical protein